MKISPIILPSHTIEISNLTSATIPYSEIVLKGPYNLNFDFTGAGDLIKIVYNFDEAITCGTVENPVSGENVIESTLSDGEFANLNTALLSATFLPSKYNYKKTYYPGLTTINSNFDTVVHQLSVTIAQPSFNQFVKNIDLIDTRSFTNVESESGQAVIVLEDHNNSWTLPLTLIGEHQYTSEISIGDTYYGNITFDVCLEKAPYADTYPSGVTVSSESDLYGSVAQGDVFIGGDHYTEHCDDRCYCVAKQFTLTNTGIRKT